MSTETAARVLAELRQVGLRVALARRSSGEPGGPSYRRPAPERFIEIDGDVQAPGEKPFLFGLTAAHAIQLGGGLRRLGRSAVIEIRSVSGDRRVVEISGAADDGAATVALQPYDKLVVEVR